MFTQIAQKSHLIVFLILTLCIQQCSGIALYAAVSTETPTYYTAPPKSYIYVRSNPIIDDSWIGTLVSFAKKPTRITTVTGSTTTNGEVTDFNSANNLQEPNAMNPIWVQDWKQTITQINGTQSNGEFNSTLFISSLQNAFSSIFNAVFERLSINESNISTLIGSFNRVNTTVNSLSGQLNTTNTRLNTTNTNLATTNTNLNNLSGALAATNIRINGIGGGGTYYVPNTLSFSGILSRV